MILRPAQGELAQAIARLVTEAGIDTKHVAVGLPSSRVFTTVADVDRLPMHELGKSIMFQADSLSRPRPAKRSSTGHLLGDSPKDKNKLEILLSSVPNKFVEDRLDIIESIGLNVIAFEPDSLALARAMTATGSPEPQLVLDVGQLSTDLVIVMGGMPRLARSIPTGVEAIVRAAQQNLNVDDKQAQQFVFKFGANKDKLEGQVYQAIIGTIDIWCPKSTNRSSSSWPVTRTPRSSGSS